MWARPSGLRTFEATFAFTFITARRLVVFPRETLSIGFRVLVSRHPAIQTTGLLLRSRASLLGFYFGTAAAERDEAEFGRSSDEILEFLGLWPVRNEVASNLPQGHLRALGIAIGLAANPRILLLDEPFAGMNADETDRAVEMVRAVRDRGVTLLLVEHDMAAVMKISDRRVGGDVAIPTPHR